MRFIRRHLLAVVVTIGAFTAAVPVSSADALTWPSGFSTAFPAGLTGAAAFAGVVSIPVSTPTVGGQAGSFGCAANTPSGNGPAGGTTNQACGSVLSFIGPSVGQIATVVGPTIIGATVLAPITVSAGPVSNG
ncbi:MAG TPA: hypothetical protein VG365_03405 [Solirubrobacteraceae bacterium]|jgi:hypothetical protein|nr:hypothetical protein [Solirubrobacteraceae bacterium]